MKWKKNSNRHAHARTHAHIVGKFQKAFVKVMCSTLECQKNEQKQFRLIIWKIPIGKLPKCVWTLLFFPSRIRHKCDWYATNIYKLPLLTSRTTKFKLVVDFWTFISSWSFCRSIWHTIQCICISTSELAARQWSQIKIDIMSCQTWYQFWFGVLLGEKWLEDIGRIGSGVPNRN